MTAASAGATGWAATPSRGSAMEPCSSGNSRTDPLTQLRGSEAIWEAP